MTSRRNDLNIDTLKWCDIPELKNEAASAICKSLDTNPGDWSWLTTKYSSIIYKSGKVELSVFGFEMEVNSPYKVKFGFINWFRLRRAFKRWKKTTGKSKKISLQKDSLLKVISALSEQDKDVKHARRY